MIVWLFERQRERLLAIDMLARTNRLSATLAWTAGMVRFTINSTSGISKTVARSAERHPVASPPVPTRGSNRCPRMPQH